MRMHFVIAVLAIVAALGCAGPAASRIPQPTPEAAALVASLRAEGVPEDMNDADRVALESAAVRIIATGRAAMPAILADIRENPDGNRRLVMIRLASMTLDRMGTESRGEVDKWMGAAAKTLLESNNAADRYTGMFISALVSRSQLTPAALKLLDDADESNRSAADAMLVSIAGLDMGFKADAPVENRKPAVARWKEWWKHNEERAFYYMPNANPVLGRLHADAQRITSQAGPYALAVIDDAGNAVPGAVVAYSYYFTTLDGTGEKKQERTATDAAGKVLMGAQKVVQGMRFVGCQIVISKAGYANAAVSIAPHVLTRNGFAIDVTLRREAK